MPARWAFEALAVEQFKSNRYERHFFSYDIEISQNNWYASFLTEALKRDLWLCRQFMDSSEHSEIIAEKFHPACYPYRHALEGWQGLINRRKHSMGSLNREMFTADAAERMERYLDSLAGQFRIFRKENIALKDSVTGALVSADGEGGIHLTLKEDYANNKLREIVTDEYNTQKTIETPGKIIQRYEPVYMKPVSRTGRAQFYAPYKQTGAIKD
ncbi:MAG: hypothetical protein U5L72_10045 [Bacteroidales bacterium]|nr:hypothetical protein [Bacteroidales bacterium]